MTDEVRNTLSYINDFLVKNNIMINISPAVPEANVGTYFIVIHGNSVLQPIPALLHLTYFCIVEMDECDIPAMNYGNIVYINKCFLNGNFDKEWGLAGVLTGSTDYFNILMRDLADATSYDYVEITVGLYLKKIFENYNLDFIPGDDPAYYRKARILFDKFQIEGYAFNLRDSGMIKFVGADVARTE